MWNMHAAVFYGPDNIMLSNDIYWNFIIMIPDYLLLNYSNDLTTRHK
jgi:hypothetical protein